MSSIKQAIKQVPGIQQLINFINGPHRAFDVTTDIRALLTKQQSLIDKQTRILQENFQRELLQQSRYQEPNRLLKYEWQVNSQHGEDGIIEEIFRRIGTATKKFIEVGVGDGTETNTTFLLHSGWAGIWIDGAAGELDRARVEFCQPMQQNRLTIVTAMVTAENIDSLLIGAGASTDLDLMSLDIDRNTFFIWKALGHYKPRVVAIEYNSTIPPSMEWCVEYAADRVWDATSYMGASLKSYEKLGTELGYSLVGCDIAGANAFFVRNDLIGDHFAAPFTAENHYEPPRYFLDRCVGHPRSFYDGGSGGPLHR